MSNKKSSIQWVVGKLGDLESMFNLKIINNIQYYEEKTKLIEQAKAMHKYEIEQAFYEGNHNSIDYWNANSEIKEYKQYYNETFGGNNE